MSENVNVAIISGNITRDPEIRQNRNGTTFLNFSVAVNDRRKDQDGEWRDYPNYIDCVVSGRRAESLSKYLFKGTKVTVKGKLKWSQWEAKDGQKRTKVELDAEQVEFQNREQRKSRNEDAVPYGSDGYVDQEYRQTRREQEEYGRQYSMYDDDDLPF